LGLQGKVQQGSPAFERLESQRLPALPAIEFTNVNCHIVATLRRRFER
jgi:hypothetical protein